MSSARRIGEGGKGSGVGPWPVGSFIWKNTSLEHRCLDASCVQGTGFLFLFLFSFSRKDPNSGERKEQLAALSVTRKARFIADVTRRIARYGLWDYAFAKHTAHLQLLLFFPKKTVREKKNSEKVSKHVFY